jgi:anti-sigma-K factor RskA
MTDQEHPDSGKCKEILPLIPAYALGAVDADEKALVEGALDDCPQARAELESYRVMLESMREDVPQIAPPPALAEKLQAAIAAEPVRSVPAEPAAPLRTERPAAAKSSHTGWYAAAAAIALLLISNLLWSISSRDLAARNARLSEDNVMLTTLLESQQDQPLLASLTGARSARLEATGDAGGYALVFWPPQEDFGMLYTDQMPPLGADQVYQLWLLREDGERVSAGIFDVDASGRGTLFFTAPAQVDSFDLAGITAEPAGGSPAPTMNPLVAGRLAS